MRKKNYEGKLVELCVKESILYKNKVIISEAIK